MLNRFDKEKMLKQQACVVWMTGLSGAGKTTLSKELEKRLFEYGKFTRILDGDELRSGINNDLGFSPEDRLENIRRTAEIAKLFMNSGIITICSLISPTELGRRVARKIIGVPNFCEVFVNCPLEECEKRDVKGLYKRARSGEISEFTGISSPFETPLNPTLEVRTDLQSIVSCTLQLFNLVISRTGNYLDGIERNFTGVV